MPNLRVDDWVEVRSKGEILRSLDENGRLEAPTRHATPLTGAAADGSLTGSIWIYGAMERPTVAARLPA
jgi:hypothetical protein